MRKHILLNSMFIASYYWIIGKLNGEEKICVKLMPEKKSSIFLITEEDEEEGNLAMKIN